MHLYNEILANTLQNDRLPFCRDNLIAMCDTLVELKCYNALKMIKMILEDNTVDDLQCFDKIEQIVRLFEELGSDAGNRHDF